MPRAQKTFHDLIGQRRVVSLVRDFCAGARRTNEMSPHLLIVGQTGMGRSVLARAIARELGSGLKAIIAGLDLTAPSVAALLTEVAGETIFFFDGIDRLPPAAQSVVAHAIAEREVPSSDGKRFDGSPPVPMPDRWTVVSSSDAPGRIVPALRSRLVRVGLDPYTPAELRAIATIIARQKGIAATPQAVRVVADGAAGSPRVIERLLDCIRLSTDGRRITEEIARSELARLGLDADGLWPQDRAYLFALADAGDDGLSAETLSMLAELDWQTLRFEVEPILLRRRLVDINGPRRYLTESGSDLVGKIRESMDHAPTDAAAIEELTAHGDDGVKLQP